MCTLASRRTALMPIGSRMPSWPSTTNSCGITCRICWSAGIASALAASITASTSRCPISRWRIGTTPTELRLRIWLPVMPTWAARTRQLAISSAASTARRIDSTVASMLTTTPFFRPRVGAVPRPITRTNPVWLTSPISAATLEVPTSRLTRYSVAWRLLMLVALCGFGPRGRRPGGCVHCLRRILAAAVRPRLSWRGTLERRAGPGIVLPAHGEAVAVAQVDVGDLRQFVVQRVHHRALQQRDLVARIVLAQAQLDAAGAVQRPRAARIEAQAIGGKGAAGQGLGHRLVVLHHFRFTAAGAGQARQALRQILRRRREGHAFLVDQALVAPQGIGL